MCKCQCPRVNFLDLFNAKITAKGTWTWTNKSTNMSSTETSTAATATVGGPGYGYPGGTLITVYYDTIYNTFGSCSDPPSTPIPWLGETC